jgi:transposase
MRSLKTLLDCIDKRCEEVFRQAPDSAERRERLTLIPGVGKLSSIGLHVSLARTPYRNSDALIAGLGLDPRPNDSGQHRGRRRLTKRGPSELRRLLYLAAVTAVRYPAFRAIYLRARSRGLGAVAALLTVSRKIARIAFAIDRSGARFDPAKLQTA